MRLPLLALAVIAANVYPSSSSAFASPSPRHPPERPFGNGQGYTDHGSRPRRLEDTDERHQQRDTPGARERHHLSSPSHHALHLPVPEHDDGRTHPSAAPATHAPPVAHVVLAAAGTNTSASPTPSKGTPGKGTVGAATVDLPTAPSAAPPTPPTPVPVPLDTSLSTGESESCVTFLDRMTYDSSISSCLPFSLLITASASYNSEISDAITTRNFTFINDLVAYAANPQPSGEQCDETYATYLTDLTKKRNCGNDMETQPATAIAQRGIGNYAPMRHAAGLINPDTGVYCYLEALADSRPDDLYLWLLASGGILPPSSTPTCSKCSQMLVNTLGEWSGNTTTLNSTTIESAAVTINAKCNASFVSMPSKLQSAATSRALPSHTTGLCLTLMSILWVLLRI